VLSRFVFFFFLVSHQVVGNDAPHYGVIA